MLTRLFLLTALAVPQTTPTGGAIAKFVPPVPTPASFISDAKDVVKADAQAALDARITAVQRAGLGDIAVAILPSIGDYSEQQVAVEIYRTWKVGSMAPIGSAHRNVGLLLLIVPKELSPNNRGVCWINTGTGAEGIITDATAAAICRDSIIPHLRSRDYAGGIGAGITALEARLRGDAGLTAPGSAAQIQSPPRQRNSRSIVGIFALVGTPFLIGGLIIGGRRWRRNRPRTCNRCAKKMRRLGEAADNAKLDPGAVMEEQIGSVDYDVWLCECGETTTIPYRAWVTKYSECRKCRRRAASAVRKIVTPASTVAPGRAEDRFTCKACDESWVVHVALPQITVHASSSSGGGSGGGGGGGGSFGGSGSTSGGGGGGSY